MFKPLNLCSNLSKLDSALNSCALLCFLGFLNNGQKAEWKHLTYNAPRLSYRHSTKRIHFAEIMSVFRGRSPSLGFHILPTESAEPQPQHRPAFQLWSTLFRDDGFRYNKTKTLLSFETIYDLCPGNVMKPTKIAN